MGTFETTEEAALCYARAAAATLRYALAKMVIQHLPVKVSRQAGVTRKPGSKERERIVSGRVARERESERCRWRRTIRISGRLHRTCKGRGGEREGGRRESQRAA